MIATNILHPSIALIIEGAKAEATKQGYQIILGVSSDDEQEEKKYVDNFLSRRVDGLIVVPTPSGKTIKDLEDLYAKGYPLVLCESATTANLDTVMADVEKGCYNAVEYLVKLGHRKIAFCAGHTEWISARFKFNGYRSALEDNQINIRDDFYIKMALSNYQAGRQGGKQIFELKDRPSAVLFHNDTMAAGAIDYFLEAGVKVPEHISVIGFNDIPLAASLKVPLTTMKSPLVDIGHRSATTVLERISQKKDKHTDNKTAQAPVSIRLTPELVERNSCSSKLN
jgi:DNA-binding LacI/PurR family transcriptional regulator